MVQDLGLDLAEAEKPRVRPRRKAVGPPIVEIIYEGYPMNVLRGVGMSSLAIEFTTENMAFLFNKVSSILASTKSAETAASVLTASEGMPALTLPASEQASGSALPESEPLQAPVTPNGLARVEDKALVPVAEHVTPEKSAKKMIWLGSRESWAVRYMDEKGIKRQKSFPSKTEELIALSACEAREEAKRSAQRWWDDHCEALRSGMPQPEPLQV